MGTGRSAGATGAPQSNHLVHGGVGSFYGPLLASSVRQRESHRRSNRKGRLAVVCDRMGFCKDDLSGVLVTILLLGVFGGQAVLAQQSDSLQAPDLTYAVGGDVSFLKAAEEQRMTFRDSGRAKPGLEIFRQHGYDWVRLRLFHSPDGCPTTSTTPLSPPRRRRSAASRFCSTTTMPTARPIRASSPFPRRGGAHPLAGHVRRGRQCSPGHQRVRQIQARRGRRDRCAGITDNAIDISPAACRCPGLHDSPSFCVSVRAGWACSEFDIG
jgi:hypothetical protein